MRVGKPLVALATLSAAAYLGLAAVSAESAAAFGDKKDETQSKAVTVMAKDKEGKVKLAKGATLELKLDYTGGTGFTWEVAKIDKDKLKSQGKPTVERPKQPRPGARTKQVFRFTAEATGKTDLELIYRRPFEKDKAPAKTYKLSVEIE